MGGGERDHRIEFGKHNPLLFYPAGSAVQFDFSRPVVLCYTDSLVCYFQDFLCFLSVGELTLVNNSKAQLESDHFQLLFKGNIPSLNFGVSPFFVFIDFVFQTRELLNIWQYSCRR